MKRIIGIFAALMLSLAATASGQFAGTTTQHGVFIYMSPTIYSNIVKSGESVVISNGTLYSGGNVVLTNVTTVPYADVAGYVKMGVTYYVSPTGNDANDGLTYPTAKATISNALGYAVNGDVVVVGPGTYDVTAEIMVTNAVTVKSSGGYLQTIVQRTGTQSNRIFTVSGIGAVVDGFTIANGIAPYDGVTLQGNGGNVLVSSGGILRNCKVINGKAFQYGGGVFGEFYGSVENCIITNNTVTNEFGLSFVVGGGVFLYGDGAELSQFYLRKSLVAGNRATGIGAGGGVALRYGNYVEQCTIVSNEVPVGFFGAYGGGVVGLNNGGTIRDSIVYHNAPNNDEPTAFGGALDNAVTHTCLTPLHAGIGNTAGDPLFVDLTNGNFSLQSLSPCIGTGSKVNGVVDMGYLAGQFKESDPIAYPWIQANIISNTINRGPVARDFGYYFNPVSTVTRPYTVSVLPDGNYAAACGAYTINGAMRFLDISNATAITLIKNLNVPSGQGAWGESCGSNHVVAMDSSGWITVFDWTDRTNPVVGLNIRARASAGYEVLPSGCGGYVFGTYNAAPNFSVMVSTNGLPTGLTNIFLGGTGNDRIGIVHNTNVYYPTTWYLASNEVSNIASGRVVDTIPMAFSNEISWGAAIGTNYAGSFVFTNFLAGANGSLSFIPGDSFRFVFHNRKSVAAAPVFVTVKLESVDDGITNVIAQSPEITMTANVNINTITSFVTVTNFTTVPATNVAFSVYVRNSTAVAQNYRIYGGTNRASSVARAATVVYVSAYSSGNIETYQLSGTNVSLINTVFASPTVSRMGAAKGHLYSVTHQGYTLDTFNIASITNPVKTSSLRLRHATSFYNRPTASGDYLYLGCSSADSPSMQVYDIRNPATPGYAFAMQSTVFTSREGGLGTAFVPSRTMIASIVPSNGSHRAVMLWEDPSARMLDLPSFVEFDPVFGLISNSIVTNLKANVTLGTNTTLLGKSTFTNGSYVWSVLDPAVGGGSISGPGGLQLNFVTGSDTIDARNAPISARATSGNLFQWVTSGGSMLGYVDYLGVINGNGGGLTNVTANYATSAGSAGSATTADTAGTSTFARTAFNVTEAYSLHGQRYYVSTGFGTAMFNTNWYWIGTYDNGYKEYRDINNLRKITHSGDPGGSWVMRSVQGGGSPVYDTPATTNDIDMVVWQISDSGDAPAGSLSNNTVNVPATVYGDLLPFASNTCSLGSTNLPWKGVFVGTSSVHYVDDNGNIVASLSADTVASMTGDSTNLVPLTAANPTGEHSVVTLGYLGNNGTSLYAHTAGDAATVGGNTAEQLTSVAATYWIWGSLNGPWSNGAITSKMAKIASPVAIPTWTSTVSGATITNGLRLGYASINTTDLARISGANGREVVHLVITRSGNAQERYMRARKDIYESDMSTLVSTYWSDDVLITDTPRFHAEFNISPTNEVIVTDTGRLVVYSFELVSGWDGETISVFSQDGDLSFITIASASGVYVDFNTWNTDKTNRANLAYENNFTGSTNTFSNVVVNGKAYVAGDASAGTEAVNYRTMANYAYSNSLFTVALATNNYTVADVDDTILCDATVSGITNSLPNATNRAGRVLTFKRLDYGTNNYVVISPVAGQMIDGQTNVNIYQHLKAITIQSYTTNWYIIGGY